MIRLVKDVSWKCWDRSNSVLLVLRKRFCDVRYM